MEGLRINKYLASCGLGARRKCEELVRQGRVAINGRTVTALGARVSPEDSVKVDGRRVRPEAETTLLLYKPKGYLCTREDPHGGDTIYQLLHPKYRRLTYVGRLDKGSEGLLLLTSSGSISQTITHPRYKIEKEYHVLLDHPLDRETAELFIQGVRTAEGIAYAHRVESMKKNWVSVVLRQGLKRQIRLMCAKHGYKVRKLIRVRIGQLVAPDLEPGSYGELDRKGIALASSNP